jgi:hypothetical protein
MELFLNGCCHFQSNVKTKNYDNIANEMLDVFQNGLQYVLIKIHFLYAYLDFIPIKYGCCQ